MYVGRSADVLQCMYVIKIVRRYVCMYVPDVCIYVCM